MSEYSSSTLRLCRVLSTPRSTDQGAPSDFCNHINTCVRISEAGIKINHHLLMNRQIRVTLSKLD
ncbi:hypothetical protein Hanom_Chr15g01348261 [Helianthus anomalus]